LNPGDILKKIEWKGIGLKSWGTFSEKLNKKEILCEIIQLELLIQKIMETIQNSDFSEAYGSAGPDFWNQSLFFFWSSSIRRRSLNICIPVATTRNKMQFCLRKLRFFGELLSFSHVYLLLVDIELCLEGYYKFRD
jgi:hypothetical protein